MERRARGSLQRGLRALLGTRLRAGAARDRSRADAFLGTNGDLVTPATPTLIESDEAFAQVIGPNGDVVLRYRRLTSCFEPTPHDVWDRYLDVYGADAIFPVARTDIGNLGTIASEEILYPEITRCIVSDDHAGLRAARRAVFTTVPWQRCQFHLQRNAQAYIPKASMRSEVARDLRAVFNATDRNDADERLAKTVEKYRDAAPKLAEWMETAIPEGLAVFALPESCRRRLRTINGLERVNRELHRRTRVATLFPNEASLLRLVSAMAAEISEEWETGRVYLRTESE